MQSQGTKKPKRKKNQIDYYMSLAVRNHKTISDLMIQIEEIKNTLYHLREDIDLTKELVLRAHNQITYLKGRIRK